MRCFPRQRIRRSRDLNEIAPTLPNADQIAYWNARAGNTWVSMQKRLDAQIGAIGLKALDVLAPRMGERVIDIGCGCGTTSFEIARRVGASGHWRSIFPDRCWTSPAAMLSKIAYAT